MTSLFFFPDESQMGGLSSLLASPPTTPTTPTTPTSPTVPKPPKKRYLQEAMGLPVASTATGPQQYKTSTEREETSPSFGTGPFEGCASTTLDFRSSSSKSSSMGLSSVNFMSPFTKLRNHAANQLNSLQEKKTNRRRASVDSITIKSKEGKLVNMKECCSKTKGSQSNMNFISSVPSLELKPKLKDAYGCVDTPAKLRTRHHRSMSHDKGGSASGSEMVAAPLTVIHRHISSNKNGDRIKPHISLETTIKASQQQIIDRVVDRLCGFAEHHARSPSPSSLLSNSSAGCNNNFIMEKSQPLETSPALLSPAKQQRNVMSSPLHLTKNSVICSNILVPKSNCKSPPVKSPVTPDAHSITSLSPGKYVSAVEGLEYGFSLDSSREFDLKNMNNNVYVSKDIASEMCKEGRMGNCRPEGCYPSFVDYGTNHTSEVAGYGDICTVAKTADSGDWNCDVQNKNHGTWLNCNRGITSDLCDKLTKTVNVIVNHTEPKLTFSESDRSCEESQSVFDFSRTSESEENDCNSEFQNENVSKLVGYPKDNSHDNRGVGFLPKLETGLDSMEESKLVSPPLYGDGTNIRTVLVHNPPGQNFLAKTEKYVHSQEERDPGLTPRLSEDRLFDDTVTKTLVNSKSSVSEKEQLSSPMFSDGIRELCATKHDSLLSSDGSENVVEDENSSVDVPPKSGSDNTFNSVPTVSSAFSVTKFNPADYEVRNSYIDIIRPKKLIHSSKKTASNLSMPNSLEHTVNGTDNDKETSDVTVFNDTGTPKTSEGRRTSQDSSKESVGVAVRPKTLECVVDSTGTKSGPTLKCTKNWASVSEDESPTPTDIPPQLPSPMEMQRRKSLRTCKGRRYREFMSEGRLVLGKRTRKNMFSSNER
jgi:hypothetical protein